jgi:hypothetical protein
MTAYRATLYETAKQRKGQEGAVGVRGEAEHFGMAVILLVILTIT